jgi:hypothetical protein
LWHDAIAYTNAASRVCAKPSPYATSAASSSPLAYAASPAAAFAWPAAFTSALIEIFTDADAVAEPDAPPFCAYAGAAATVSANRIAKERKRMLVSSLGCA